MNETVPAATFEPDTSAWPAGHPKTASGRIGVLLLNLGTPDGTDYWSIRRYLKEFLSDRRVIEVPWFVWWPILNLVILTKRPGPKGGKLVAGASLQTERKQRQAKRSRGGGLLEEDDAGSAASERNNSPSGLRK